MIVLGSKGCPCKCKTPNAQEGCVVRTEVTRSMRLFDRLPSARDACARKGRGREREREKEKNHMFFFTKTHMCCMALLIQKRRSKLARTGFTRRSSCSGLQLNDTRGSASALSAPRRHVTLTAGLATHTTGSARSPVRPIYLDAGSSGTLLSSKCRPS